MNGETDTPDFSIDTSGQPVSLKTRYRAVVDGTNGDTFLEQVDARIGETLIVCKGAVVRTEDVKGRRVGLDIAIEEGRIEDVLRLGMKGPRPIMTGRMQLATSFLLPAGDRDVLDKLELSGTFNLDQARFANMDIQRRINELSRRGQGNWPTRARASSRSCRADSPSGEARSVSPTSRSAFLARSFSLPGPTT